METVRPHVVVQDTRPLRVANFAAPPMVASFYVPMPVNLGAVGLSTCKTSEEHASVSLDFPALDAAQEFERSHARLTAIQAIQDAQAKHVQGVMKRVAEAATAAAQPPAAAPKLSTTDTCCDDLLTQLKALNNRVERLELLVHIHDKLIPKDSSLKGPESSK